MEVALNMFERRRRYENLTRDLRMNGQVLSEDLCDRVLRFVNSDARTRDLAGEVPRPRLDPRGNAERLTPTDRRHLVGLLNEARAITSVPQDSPTFKRYLLFPAAVVVAAGVLISAVVAGFDVVQSWTDNATPLSAAGVSAVIQPTILLDSDRNNNRGYQYYGDAVLVDDLATVDAPPRCVDWGPWMVSATVSSQGVVPAGNLKRRVIVQTDGTSASVAVTALEVEVTARRTPPPDKDVYVCSHIPDAGPGLQPRKIAVNLDSPEPLSFLVNEEQLGGPVTYPFTLPVTPSQPVEIWIVAYTESCDCDWRATLVFLIDGQEVRHDLLDASGESGFRTSASTEGAEVLFWSPTQGAKSDVPEEVSFGFADPGDVSIRYGPAGISRYGVGWLPEAFDSSR